VALKKDQNQFVDGTQVRKVYLVGGGGGGRRAWGKRKLTGSKLNGYNNSESMIGGIVLVKGRHRLQQEHRRIRLTCVTVAPLCLQNQSQVPGKVAPVTAMKSTGNIHRTIWNVIRNCTTWH
jgi:hypothetical protein